MRSVLPAIAVCLFLLSIAADLVMGSSGPSGNPPASASPAPASTPAAEGDAAAKHAKRTACIKTAKAKKLVGAQKTAFIKECIAAP